LAWWSSSIFVDAGAVCSPSSFGFDVPKVAVSGPRLSQVSQFPLSLSFFGWLSSTFLCFARLSKGCVDRTIGPGVEMLVGFAGRPSVLVCSVCFLITHIAASLSNEAESSGDRHVVLVPCDALGVQDVVGEVWVSAEYAMDLA